MVRLWHRLFGHGLISSTISIDEWLSGLDWRCKCGSEGWNAPRYLPSGIRVTPAAQQGEGEGR